MSLYFIIPDNPFSNSGSTPVRSIGISSCIRKMRDAVHIRIKENPYLKSVDDFVYSSDGKTLVQSPLWKEGEVVIPEGVTRIGGSAFSASRISSVVLPSSVTVVGTNAFSFCSKLRTVVLNEGLREIYSVAFEGDDKIKKIRLPESLTSVGYDAFSLSNLEEIEIGGNVIPQGLIRAVGKSDDNFPVKCNLGNGRTFFIPASLDKTVDISLVDDADLDTLYLFSLSSFAKRLCAVHAYKVSGREDTAKFLRRVAKSLVEYYFRKNDEPALVELVHMGVCTSATLTYALDNAKAKNMTTLTAEILSLTEESKKSKKSFNL